MDFAQQLAEVNQGQHLCLLYDDPEEQFAAISPFLAECLRRGERCYYIVDERTVPQVLAAISSAGVDAESEMAKGNLEIVTKYESYLLNGKFEPAFVLDFLDQTVTDAVREGWTGIRFAGEMTWALDGGTTPELLIQYEALLNEFFPRSKATGLCQYNRSRFPPEIVYDVLCTHPVAVIGQNVCPNLFYEPPRLVLDDTRKADRVDWRIAQLLRARAVEQSLEEANRVKSDFLAAMSHDLRTPLNAIIGLAQIAQAGISGEVSAALRKHFERIEANAAQLLGMIDELLGFAKVEAGREEINPERVTLTRLVFEAVRVIAGAAEAKGLRVEVDVERKRQVLWTDKGKMEKVLLNLLSNSVKYTDSGVVTVRARVEENGEECAVFEVKDSGRGIDPDHHEMIFEPFWRVKGNQEQGTGLGLNVSRRMARMVGGDIRIQSRLGEGSTFTVSIPATYRGLGRS